MARHDGIVRWQFNEGGHLFTFAVFRRPLGIRFFFGPGWFYVQGLWWPLRWPRIEQHCEYGNTVNVKAIVFYLPEFMYGKLHASPIRVAREFVSSLCAKNPFA